LIIDTPSSTVALSASASRTDCRSAATVDAEIRGNMRDRPTGRQHEPHRAFAQVVRILLGGRHR